MEFVPDTAPPTPPSARRQPAVIQDTPAAHESPAASAAGILTPLQLLRVEALLTHGESNGKKSGNGHGPRITPDQNTGFDYEADQKVLAPLPAGDAPAHGADSTSPNLRLTIIAADPLSQQGSNMQADAPACDVCGSITVRSGHLLQVLNCGNSMG
jgi:hypothetical protein